MGKVRVRKIPAVAAAKATVSKRSQKKVVQLKVQRGQRREDLILKLNGRRDDDALREAQGAFVGADMLGALDDALGDVAPSPKKQASVPGKTNRGKRLLAQQEAQQLGAVLGHRAFQVDPIATIREHLDNSLPRAEAPAPRAPKAPTTAAADAHDRPPNVLQGKGRGKGGRGKGSGGRGKGRGKGKR
ncbi:hypothetical protein M885DRAFT_612042 [Pelagophyceae sp. CCMP2097]|nr:hypothetical protein M885DRAFT_612042 [Pelagophyceae sp. CCMP2097]